MTDWASEKTTKVIKVIEHGDEKHRQWLHEIGHAVIAQALREARAEGMREIVEFMRMYRELNSNWPDGEKVIEYARILKQTGEESAK